MGFTACVNFSCTIYAQDSVPPSRGWTAYEKEYIASEIPCWKALCLETRAASAFWFVFPTFPKLSMRVVTGYRHGLAISFWKKTRKVVGTHTLLPIPPYHQWLPSLVHRGHWPGLVCLQLCMSWPNPGPRILQKNPTSRQGQKSCSDNGMVWTLFGTLFDQG